MWEPQVEALFDVRVVDTDAPSYGSSSPGAVVRRAEMEKKNKYFPACDRRHASFTPLVTSVDGLMGVEFQALIRVLAERLREKWHRPYSHVINWLRVRIGCATLRASSMCLRRSRKRWRSGREFGDGAGIPLFF